jgi:hypothetical protein
MKRTGGRDRIRATESPLARALSEMEEAARRREGDGAERSRSLIDRIDTAIAACEQVHLERRDEVTQELISRAREAAAEATSILPPVGDRCLEAIITRVSSGHAVFVQELMEGLWETQALAFDLLMPSRRGFRDNRDHRETRRQRSRDGRPDDHTAAMAGSRPNADEGWAA